MNAFVTIFAFLAALLASAKPLLAWEGAIGTWVPRSHPGMTMTVESYGVDGRKLTYRVKKDTKDIVIVVESAMDGTDAPVMINGQPSGETMGIKRLDGSHSFTVIKFKGQQVGTSKAELSADGKTLTVENDMQSPAPDKPIGKATEIWDRK